MLTVLLDIDMLAGHPARFADIELRRQMVGLHELVFAPAPLACRFADSAGHRLVVDQEIKQPGVVTQMLVKDALAKGA